MHEAHSKTTAVETEFASRIDRIRARVALKLASKIEQTDAALSQMTGDASEAVDAVATAYRWFHDISGIGPTVGFDQTGQWAQSCADILASSFHARRGLSPDELALLTTALQSFQIAALKEAHLAGLNQRTAE
jgi:hypothetical protein